MVAFVCFLSLRKLGYDALKPWRFAAEIKYFPYTHNWRAVAALDYVLDKLEDEGFDNVHLYFHRSLVLGCTKAQKGCRVLSRTYTSNGVGVVP